MKTDNPKIPIDRVIYKIKSEINPYGKPFEGSAYEFGKFLMEWLERCKEFYDDIGRLERDE